MKRENRFEIIYIADGVTKHCCPRSVESRDRNLEKCKELGYEVINCRKLYPFNTMKNQHNFDLIHSICYNRMHDMESGEIAWDDEEYDRLTLLREDASRFFVLDLPIAWLPYTDWARAKELSEMAILHRQNACIENGRPDLVTYC